MSQHEANTHLGLALSSVWPLLRQLRSAVAEATKGESNNMLPQEEEEEDEEEGNGKMLEDVFQGMRPEDLTGVPSGSDCHVSSETARARRRCGERAQHFGQLRSRLELFLYETFTALRISELFDIIVDFPDSQVRVLLELLVRPS
jgi:hypothetical protein